MFSKRVVAGLVGLLFFASVAPAFAASNTAQQIAPFLPAAIQGITSLLGLTKSVGGQGGEPHPICEAWVKRGKKPPQPPQCTVSTGVSGSGPVVGVCVETLCKATQLPGGSSPDSGGQALQQMLQQLMQKLMQGNQGQPASGGGETLPGATAPASGSQYPPCQINPATQTVTGVPCIDSTGALVTSTQWLGAGEGGVSSSGGTTAGSIADLLSGSLGSSGGGSSSGDAGGDLLQAVSGQSQSGQSSTTTTAGGGTNVSNSSGDIVVNQKGVTAVAGKRDDASNTEVSGFVGSDTGGIEQAKSATARLCESRPWAGGVLSSIIAPSFFDGVCAWRGYHVGPIPNVTVQIPVMVSPTSGPKKTTQTQVPQVPVGAALPVSVDIWASPASVPLGTRTTIFWRATNAASCTVSGLNFNQSGIVGGAATVPILEATTFSVVCLNTLGEEGARGSVTVKLAI